MIERARAVLGAETGLAGSRAGRALRRGRNWMQLAKFSFVGATGYVVNLVVYTALLRAAGLHYLLAAVCSFVVAVSNNYTWNRLWTFRDQRGHIGIQGARFFAVAVVALGANLACLRTLVAFGLGKVLAQAIAVALVTPINFVGNKLWSFRRPYPAVPAPAERPPRGAPAAGRRPVDD